METLNDTIKKIEHIALEKGNYNLANELFHYAQHDYYASKILFEEKLYCSALHHLAACCEKLLKAHFIKLGWITEKEAIEDSHDILALMSRIAFLKDLQNLFEALDNTGKTTMIQDREILHSKSINKKAIANALSKLNYNQILELKNYVDQLCYIKTCNVSSIIEEKNLQNLNKNNELEILSAITQICFIAFLVCPHFVPTRYPKDGSCVKDYNTNLGVISAIPLFHDLMDDGIKIFSKNYNLL